MGFGEVKRKPLNALLGARGHERTTMSATDDTNTTDVPTPTLGSSTDADVCGALGCHETNGLRPVEHTERGTRVLCDDHRRDFRRLS
jgi:hypothetical protein